MTAPSEFTMSSTASKQQMKKKGDTATATAPRRPQPQPLRRQQQQRQELTACPLRAWSLNLWTDESINLSDLDGENAQWWLVLRDDVLSLILGAMETLKELLSIAVGNDVMSIMVRATRFSS